ncbi:MAG: methyltransferase domain-containing protein [Terriglobia bacterium]
MFHIFTKAALGRMRLKGLLLAALLAAPPVAGVEQEARVRGDPRDAWQRPAEVLDALGVREGSVVADVGCGRGYFTAHLARRVGPEGVVYAVDIDEAALAAVTRLVERNPAWRGRVRLVRSQPDDPRLPTGRLDVVLIVDTYHEFRTPDAMLEKIFAALKPGGRVGIIDRAAEPGQSRSVYRRRHRIPKEIVVREATRHNFILLREAPGFTRPRRKIPMYFLVFQKPARRAGGQD